MSETIHPLAGQIADFLKNKKTFPKHRNFFEDWLESYFLYKLVEKGVFGDILHARHFSEQVGREFQPGGGFEPPLEIKDDSRYAMMREFHEAIFNKTLSETLFAVEKLLRGDCRVEAFDFRKNLARVIKEAKREFGAEEGETEAKAAEEGGDRVIEVDFKEGKRK